MGATHQSPVGPALTGDVASSRPSRSETVRVRPGCRIMPEGSRIFDRFTELDTHPAGSRRAECGAAVGQRAALLDRLDRRVRSRLLHAGDVAHGVRQCQGPGMRASKTSLSTSTRAVSGVTPIAANAGRYFFSRRIRTAPSRHYAVHVLGEAVNPQEPSPFLPEDSPADPPGRAACNRNRIMRTIITRGPATRRRTRAPAPDSADPLCP